MGTRFHVKVENKTSEVTSTTYGISIKGDVLYVAESGNHCVQMVTSRGEFSHTFGQTGSGQGEVIIGYKYSMKLVVGYPWGLALDPQGNIHVAALGTILISKSLQRKVCMSGHMVIQKVLSE